MILLKKNIFFMFLNFFIINNNYDRYIYMAYAIKMYRICIKKSQKTHLKYSRKKN